MNTASKLLIFFCFAFGVFVLIDLIISLNHKRNALNKPVSFDHIVTAEAFKRDWRENEESFLVTYSTQDLTGLPINDTSRTFLVEAGLPKYCPPSLNFNEKLYSDTLKNVKEVCKLTHDDFTHFYVIGSDENGNMICIDTKDSDRIKAVDVAYVHTVDHREPTNFHSNYVPIWFVNSSVRHLANCLLLYQNFNDTTTINTDQEEWTQPEVDRTKQVMQSLRKELLKIDPACLQEKSLWGYETSFDVRIIEFPTSIAPPRKFPFF